MKNILINQGIDQWVISSVYNLDTYYDNTKKIKLSFYSAVFRNLKTNEIMIAYRGTDSFDDVKYYTEIVSTQKYGQGSFALQVFDKTYSLYPKSKIYLTGHSLGGFLSTYVFMNNTKNSSNSSKPIYSLNNVYCYAFDAPPSQDLLDRIKQNKNSFMGRLNNYYTSYDTRKDFTYSILKEKQSYFDANILDYKKESQLIYTLDPSNLIRQNYINMEKNIKTLEILKYEIQQSAYRSLKTETEANLNLTLHKVTNFYLYLYK
jgi:phage anti-repressor protein